MKIKNPSKLKEEIIRDEGVVYAIYKDHLGYPTFGIGHLVKDSDPEFGQPVDTPVSEERVDEVARLRSVSKGAAGSTARARRRRSQTHSASMGTYPER